MPFRLYRVSGYGHVNAADSAMDLDEVWLSLYEYVVIIYSNFRIISYYNYYTYLRI